MQRGKAVAGLALIALAALVVTGPSSWSWSVPWFGPVTEHREQFDPGIRVVALDTGSGDVTIRAGDRAVLATRVDAWSWTRPDPTHHRDGDTLVLSGCGGWCDVDYELVVPPGTRVEGEAGSGDVTVVGAAAVDVEVGSGDVEVRGVPGTVAVDTGSGEVLLADLRGTGTVATSSGSIRGELLRGPVSASTSSGDIELELARAQHVTAETSSGDVELTVPAGEYRVHTTGDDEQPDLEVIDDPDARYSLELRTSSGDITVARG